MKQEQYNPTYVCTIELQQSKHSTPLYILHVFYPLNWCSRTRSCTPIHSNDTNFRIFETCGCYMTWAAGMSKHLVGNRLCGRQIIICHPLNGIGLNMVRISLHVLISSGGSVLQRQYSSGPINGVALNKRVGWIFCSHFIGEHARLLKDFKFY